MKENYDLQKELGPINQYDEIAGRAQRIGYLFKDLHLIELGSILASYINKYEYNSDKFYLVIAKAKEVQKYLKLIEKETFYLEDYIVKKEDLSYPSDLKLYQQNNLTTLYFGTYKFHNGENPLTPELLEKIIHIIETEFPFFVSKEEEETEVKHVHDGLGGFNKYTIYKDNEGKPMTQLLDRVHEAGEYGKVFYYFFPERVEKEKIILIFNRIKKTIEESGLIVEPNEFSKSMNQRNKDRILAESIGLSPSEFYFEQESKEILAKREEENFIDSSLDLLERHLENKQTSLAYFLDFYKKVILKASQEFPDLNLNDFKHNLQTLIRIKKYLLEISKEIESNSNLVLELDNFENFLTSLNLSKRFLSRDKEFYININEKSEEIQSKIQAVYKNIEIINFKDDFNTGFFIIFKPKNSENKFIYSIRGFLGNPEEVSKQYKKLFD